jgi:acyl-CoA synthetase (AMP-forming)/AMP-acid ligase II
MYEAMRTHAPDSTKIAGASVTGVVLAVAAYGLSTGLGVRIVKAITPPMVVVNLPDERKGERLIALVTLELDAANLREKLLAGGLTTLALPAQYVKVDAVPKLGSGKTDFAAARTLAISRVTLA